ncbi:replicative DNA helicase [Bacillus sp. FSL K6-3431]|uniref:replicative DNA helicase n=1 Tax=Bacillus sp. FSL K6-3431 TaxID=2921500 RepID=UPI0030F654EA
MYAIAVNQDPVYDAEAMVIGALFLEPDAIHVITLQPEHFSHARHRIIFQACRELATENIHIDMVTIAARLGGSMENAGGATYITELAISCPSVAHITHYEEIIFTEYRKQQLVKAAASFLNDRSESSAERLYQTYIEMEQIGRNQAIGLEGMLKELKAEMKEDKGELSGLDTGFVTLNRMTGGLQGGDLIILAARPSMGKTASALNVAKSICHSGEAVELFSLEMPGKQLAQRMLSSLSNVHGSKWQNPFQMFSYHDKQQVHKAMEEFSTWQMNIHDHAAMTVADILAALMKAKREHPDKSKEGEMYVPSCNILL